MKLSNKRDDSQENTEVVKPKAIESLIPPLDPEILELLLKDCTTKKNIIWGTDNYASHGSHYESKAQIEFLAITGHRSRIIKPRVNKSKKEQITRTKQKAEIFTPSWVCNNQNNTIDTAWFGRTNVFNQEVENGWITNKDKIYFDESKSWQDYVKALRMEITCGEAPYLVSRYDASKGLYIEIEDRIGILDRKLRVVNENTTTEKEWFEWCLNAYKATYAYEFQGDNLLLARENLITTFIEYYSARFGKKPSLDLIKQIAEIVIWNLWQMDGLKFTVPFSCHNERIEDVNLFGEVFISETICDGCKNDDITKHNGIYAKIMDWEKGKPIKALSLLRG